MREVPAPSEFVSYVDRRLRPLESAALRLTGDEALAERLARELMTLTALRWGRLAKADARHELPPGESADVYITKLFHQEAAELGYPRTVLNLESVPVGRRRPVLAGQLPAAEEATLLWSGARRKLRRRLLIGAGAGAILALAALCRRGGDSSDQQLEETTPLAVSTGLPDGVVIMPTGVLALRGLIGVPEKLSLPASPPPPISASPLPRAILLVGSTVLPNEPVYALADNGTWRHLDTAPRGAGTLLAPNSLSPDGKVAVFGVATGSVLVDLTTGVQQVLPEAVPSARPVWLSEQQVLFSSSALLDRVSGKLDIAGAGPENTVTPRLRESGDRTNVMIELLPAGQPLTAPARVRRWSLMDRTSVTVPLSGLLSDLVGQWEGPAIGYGDDRVARLCRPTDRIPSAVRVSWMVAVLSPKTGEVVRLLMIDSANSGVPALLGWESERRLLLTLTSGGGQEIVNWDLSAGAVSRVSRADFVGTLSMRDLTRV